MAMFECNVNSNLDNTEMKILNATTVKQNVVFRKKPKKLYAFFNYSATHANQMLMYEDATKKWYEWYNENKSDNTTSWNGLTSWNGSTLAFSLRADMGNQTVYFLAVY